MIISDFRMAKISFCDRHVIKMTLSYLTTQGNRVPFIHKGSRLSPESYALSHQPHICQRSQQMQNILKIFETYVNSRELLAELRTIVNWQNLMTLEVGCEHIGTFSCTNLFANCEFWVTCHFYLSPKIFGCKNVSNLRLCERPLMRKDPLWLALPHSTKPPRNQLHPESQTSCK